MKFPVLKSLSSSNVLRSAESPFLCFGASDRSGIKKPVVIFLDLLEKGHSVSFLGSQNRLWRILTGQLDFQRKSGFKLLEVTFLFLFFLWLEEERTKRQWQALTNIIYPIGQKSLPVIRGPVICPGCFLPSLFWGNSVQSLLRRQFADSPRPALSDMNIL